jgi:hypothetical protein
MQASTEVEGTMDTDQRPTTTASADAHDLSLRGAVQVGNPIVTDVYTSDPAVMVHEGTAYLYTGHDEAPPGVEGFVMHDWLCFSSTDLLTWRAQGRLLPVGHFEWAGEGAKAGTVIERDGRFFWYVAVNHSSIDGGAIGVAVTSRANN